MQSSDETEMKITGFLHGFKYLFISKSGDMLSFGCFYPCCKFRSDTCWPLFPPGPQLLNSYKHKGAAQETHMRHFLWRTTGWASVGSACWSHILSVKVMLRFSEEKGKKTQGKWNAAVWGKIPVLKIIKDTSGFRRSLTSEPRVGVGRLSDT